MELNIGNDKIMSMVNSTFDKYLFLEFSESQKESIIKKALEILKENYNNKLTENNLNRAVEFCITNIIKKYLADYKTRVMIINKYLDSLPNVDSLSMALDNLKKLDMFTRKYDYILDKNTVKRLLVHSSIFNVIANYCINDRKNIKDDNYVLKLIMEIYVEDLNDGLLDTDGVKDAYDEYIKEVRKIPLLNDKKERNLLIACQNGDISALNKLTEGNLRFVVCIAKRYLGHGLPLEDLIQEGNMGLVEAIKRYDFTKNSKLSTYAYHWIKRYIIRAIKKYGKGIRIPEHIFDGMVKYKKAREELENKIGREATIEEVAKYMDISVENAVVFDNAIDETSSLNVIVNDDVEVSHLIASDDVSIEDMIMEDDMKLNVQRLLDNARLTDKEKDIISERYGFNGKNPKTLEEIGKKYGITRERVRQIETRIFTKLRQVRDINSYMVYLNNDESLNKVK